MQFIGLVAVAEYREVPIFNPGAKALICPRIELAEEITPDHLMARREGVLIRREGEVRVNIRKETENGEAVFTAL